MIEELDQGTGKILNALEVSGMSKNTIVIFFSDNGATGLGSNGDLRGVKGQVYEGGIRVPCIIRWPGHLKAGTVSRQLSVGFDLTASILCAAGINIKDYALDGIDLIGKLERDDLICRTIYWRKKRGANVLKAVRDGDYKYISIYSQGEPIEEALYNLHWDPAESKNILDSSAGILESMKEKLYKWEMEMIPEWLDELEENPGK